MESEISDNNTGWKPKIWLLPESVWQDSGIYVTSVELLDMPWLDEYLMTQQVDNFIYRITERGDLQYD